MENLFSQENENVTFFRLLNESFILNTNKGFMSFSKLDKSIDLLLTVDFILSFPFVILLFTTLRIAFIPKMNKIENSNFRTVVYHSLRIFESKIMWVCVGFKVGNILKSWNIGIKEGYKCVFIVQVKIMLGCLLNKC